MQKEWTVPVIEELEVSETKGGGSAGLENGNDYTTKSVDFSS